MRNILETLNLGISSLQKAGTENPFLEAELLLEHVTGIKRLEIHAHCFEPMLSEKETEFFELIERREKHEPVQYIIGETDFLDYTLRITPAVLIPRPETELLVDYIKNSPLEPKRILDIGTGSGAIAIALKSIYPKAEVYATDISAEAIQVALENAKNNGLVINFIEADIFPIKEKKFDLIVSNPPYIKQADYEVLPKEVLEFEPQSALLAEMEGLDFYDRIIKDSKEYLTENGTIFFEIGEEQAPAIEKLAKKYGYMDIDTFQDLCDKDRYIRIKRNDKELDIFKLL